MQNLPTPYSTPAADPIDRRRIVLGRVRVSDPVAGLLAELVFGLAGDHRPHPAPHVVTEQIEFCS